MFLKKGRRREFFAWFWVFLCVLGIFLIVPLARLIQDFVSKNLGRSAFGYFVITITALFSLLSGLFLYFRLKIRKLTNYLWLSLIAFAYFYLTLRLWKRPEEAIHFIEYGLLGFLLFKALSLKLKDEGVFLIGFLIGSLVGIFDEVFQWAVPGRYWGFRDVGLNALASFLIQLGIWKGIEPKITLKKINLNSLRISSFLLGINIFLLSLCFSNTPQRVSAYTRHFPFLLFLQNEEPMQEIKKKHKDEEIGIFFSRLTLRELKSIDREEASKNSEILKSWKKKKYMDFLDQFPEQLFPFLHEFRVRVFRRDQKYIKAMKTNDLKEKREAFFIAYKENLILDKYFGKTLQKSSYKWSKRNLEEAEKFIDKMASYRSPVGADFLPLRESTVWIFTLSLLFSIFLLNLYLTRLEKKIDCFLD